VYIRLSPYVTFVEIFADHQSGATLFQEDLSQPTRNRPLATRGEPCQVPVLRSSYVSFRICDVTLGHLAGITSVCDPSTVISTRDATAKKETNKRRSRNLRLRFLRLPICSSKTSVFHVVPETHHTSFAVVLLRDTYVFLRIPMPLNGERTLDFLEFLLLSTLETREKRKIDFSADQSSQYRVLR